MPRWVAITALALFLACGVSEEEFIQSSVATVICSWDGIEIIKGKLGDFELDEAASRELEEHYGISIGQAIRSLAGVYKICHASAPLICRISEIR